MTVAVRSSMTHEGEIGSDERPARASHTLSGGSNAFSHSLMHRSAGGSRPVPSSNGSSKRSFLRELFRTRAPHGSQRNTSQHAAVPIPGPYAQVRGPAELSGSGASPPVPAPYLLVKGEQRPMEGWMFTKPKRAPQ